MIKILRSFLINTIYTFHYIISVIFKKCDYCVVERIIEYSIIPDQEFKTNEPFWNKHAHEHDQTTKYYLINTRIDDVIPTPPDTVDKMIIRIKYWYNNKIYKYITNNPNYVWPPPKPKSIFFHIPLSSAQLMDNDDKPVKDILEKIRRYGGPRADFYGEKVKISDMFYYTDSFLATTYPKIKIKNYFGMIKSVNTATGYLTDLRLP
jgi:hypothetical protein